MSDAICRLLDLSEVHEQWRPLLDTALQQVAPDYLERLLKDEHWLPGRFNMFAAFRRDLQHCRYILFGESPYPRKESANGIAFYDAAVSELWSETGLSKSVNRATSLRNIIKTALVAEGRIQPATNGKISQSLIAEVDKTHLISTIDELFDNLQACGLLLFNATPVLHNDMPPATESRYWSGFLNQLLVEIKTHSCTLPTLILWGKIAQRMDTIAGLNDYRKLSSEHPYNLSFIHNEVMQNLFARLKMLEKRK